MVNDIRLKYHQSFNVPFIEYFLDKLTYFIEHQINWLIL